MAQIISFQDIKVKKEREQENALLMPFPTKQEVQELRENFEWLQEQDALIGLEDWSGECWKELFQGLIMNYAFEYNEDPWDVFAAFIKKTLLF